MRLSERQTRRLKKSFDMRGAQAIKHGNVGRRPVNATAKELQDKILEVFLDWREKTDTKKIFEQTFSVTRTQQKFKIKLPQKFRDRSRFSPSVASAATAPTQPVYKNHPAPEASESLGVPSRASRSSKLVSTNKGALTTSHEWISSQPPSLGQPRD